MFHFARTPGALPLAVLLASTLALVAALAGDRLEQPPAPSSPEEAIERALETKVSLKFAGTPLADVVDQLSKSQKIPILLSRRDLEDAGIDLATPIDFECREMTLDSALYHLLSPLALGTDSNDGALTITTSEKAQQILKVRVYDVKDLLLPDEAGNDDYKSLIDMIQATLSPTSWNDVGGPGWMSSYSGLLVLSQTDSVHREMRQLLAALRKVAARQKDGNTAPVWLLPAAHEQALAEVGKRLDQFTRLEAKEQTLVELLKSLEKAQGLNIRIDRKALEEAGIAPDTPLFVVAVNLPLKTTLDHTLNQAGLLLTFVSETLLVTTPEGCNEGSLLSRVYPVGDLIAATPTDEFDEPSDDYDSLIELIQSTVKPMWWDDVGGRYSIDVHEGTKSLVCSSDFSTHQEIEKLLATIRRMRPKPAEAQPAAADRRVVRVYTIVEKNGKPSADADEVAQLLTDTVEPEAWKQPDIYIRPIAGRLMVRQTPAVHKKIGRLLEKLGLGSAGWSGGKGGSSTGPETTPQTIEGEKKSSGSGFF